MAQRRWTRVACEPQRGHLYVRALDGVASGALGRAARSLLVPWVRVPASGVACVLVEGASEQMLDRCHSDVRKMGPRSHVMMCRLRAYAPAYESHANTR